MHCVSSGFKTCHLNRGEDKVRSGKSWLYYETSGFLLRNSEFARATIICLLTNESLKFLDSVYANWYDFFKRKLKSARIKWCVYVARALIYQVLFFSTLESDGILWQLQHKVMLWRTAEVQEGVPSVLQMLYSEDYKDCCHSPRKPGMGALQLWIKGEWQNGAGTRGEHGIVRAGGGRNEAEGTFMCPSEMYTLHSGRQPNGDRQGTFWTFLGTLDGGLWVWMSTFP